MFKFKHFEIHDELSAMKIGTDGSCWVRGQMSEMRVASSMSALALASSP